MPFLPTRDARTFPSQAGFTLLELSISILVIGMIIGAVTAGVGLIKHGKTQAVLTEVTQYRSAIDRFQQKYGGVPGDYSEAVNTFGASVNGVTILNGGGNGLLSAANEEPQAWLHLQVAGLIPGEFSGTHTGGAMVPGVNVPASKVGGGYSLTYATGSATWNTLLGNILLLGNTSTGLTRKELLPVEMALEIDTKMDDGLPYTGDIRPRSDLTNCTSGVTTAMIYDVANYKNAKNCSLSFRF